MKNVSSWTQESSENESLAFLKARAYSHALKGGEQGRIIADYISCDNLSALCDFNLSYDAITAYQAYNCRQSLAFFTKYEPLKLGNDRKATAVAKFKEAEAVCKQTNDIFRHRFERSIPFEPHFEQVLMTAQRKIAMVLGDCPSLSDLNLRFGPGATTLTKKKGASTVEKLGAGLACSEDLLPVVRQLMQELPQLAELHDLVEQDAPKAHGEWWKLPIQVMDGEVRFVPKNAKTHRSIVVEPPLNTLVQLGIGDYIASRLLRFGIDIEDQSKNKGLARAGSITGEYATLDLSSASDTVATQLVYELLPYEWVILLNFARTSRVLFEGNTIELEKFSSMGNGFTFPLETLIFWALSSSASSDDFASVYGDDIIVSTHSVAQVVETLVFCGFEINKAKSYWTGSFRESCGGDYLSGIDIRPYYQKKLVSPAELFRLHNYYVRTQQFDDAEEVLKSINPSLRLWGPDGFGDGHLLGDWRPRAHKKSASHGYGGAIFDTFTLGGRKDLRALRPGDRVLPTYSIYTSQGTDKVLPDNVPPLVAKKYGQRLASEPIPERRSPVTGEVYKTPSFPGTQGYRRVSIYTFDK